MQTFCRFLAISNITTKNSFVAKLGIQYKPECIKFPLQQKEQNFSVNRRCMKMRPSNQLIDGFATKHPTNAVLVRNGFLIFMNGISDTI